MIYLASPYSDKSPRVVEDRVLKTRIAFKNLCDQGYIIFSPILMCHEVCLTQELPTDAAYWERNNTAFVRRSDMLFVLCIQGWATSLGVSQEIRLAKQLFIPVLYVDMDGTILNSEDLPA